MELETSTKIDRTKPGWWREYYRLNKAKVSARNKAWLKRNIEKMRPKLRAKWRRNAVKNRDRIKMQRASRRLKNPEKFRARNREWQRRQWVYRQAYMRDYYQRNREKIKTASRKAYAENKPRAMAFGNKRRALKRSATINLRNIEDFIRRVRSKPTARCYYCSVRVSTRAPGGMHFDHMIPLSKGGPHSVENLCVSCPECNLTKHAQPMQEWLRIKIGQRFLDL